LVVNVWVENELSGNGVDDANVEAVDACCTVERLMKAVGLDGSPARSPRSTYLVMFKTV
jgi:hypothetical protein